MKPPGRRRRLLRTVEISNPAIWQNNRTGSKNQVRSLSQVMVNTKLPVQKTPCGHEGRKQDGHVMPVNVRILPAVSLVSYICVADVKVSHLDNG